MIEFHNEKMMTIANRCDYIIGNKEETLILINDDKMVKKKIKKKVKKIIKRYLRIFKKN